MHILHIPAFHVSASSRGNKLVFPCCPNQTVDMGVMRNGTDPSWLAGERLINNSPYLHFTGITSAKSQILSIGGPRDTVNIPNRTRRNGINLSHLLSLHLVYLHVAIVTGSCKKIIE